VLDEYLRESVVLEVASPEDSAPPVGQLELPLNQIGDLCPECGQATLLNIEGCKKCINCGYSEC
jgi:ribonucleoside-diphosphate reductase alpha chain